LPTEIVPPQLAFLEGLRDVRFGSLADKCNAKRRVRFAPDSDRESGFSRKVMSALPPKAGMCSARGHVRFGPIADMCHSIDHLVGELLEKQGDVDVERFCRLLIDEKLKFRWLLDGQIGRLCSL
jgi:hypothetical protein